MKRFGHKIIAHPQTGERALDSLNDSRRVAPNLIERTADAHHLVVELAGSGNIAVAGGGAKLDVEFGKYVCSARHTAMAAD